MKVNTRKALFEFASIVIAVVLAMGLTEWRQDYLNEKLAEKSFDNIVIEIRDNLEQLREDSLRIAGDHEFMRDWARKTMSNEPAPSFKANFRLSILSNAAWEVAKVNQSLTHLSNQKNMDMAGIYALQDFYMEKASEVFDLMGTLQSEVRSQDSDEFFKVVQKLRYHLSLVFNTMKAYIVGCEEFLEEYAAP